MVIFDPSSGDGSINTAQVKPDAGMDLGVRRERHNWNPTMAEPRDWGKYIRVNDVRYGALGAK